MSAVSRLDSVVASNAAEPTQADCIRNAMSLDNLLIAPTATAEMNAASPPGPSSASSSSTGEESSSAGASPDTVMTEPVLIDCTCEETGEEDKDVPDAEREFICLNDEHTRCRTGQYTKDLSRKVISDHFGRNKACTRHITEWPLFCRKHYQRATYNKPKWQLRKVHLILRQFHVIERQFPGTTYDITLKKSEEARLNQYARHIASGMTGEAAAESVAPVQQSKHYEAPIDVLRELDQWLGRGKSYAHVKDIVDVILQMLEAHECDQVPAIEFLPQLPGSATSSKKSSAKPRAAKSPRVSAKGAVKKTAANKA